MPQYTPDPKNPGQVLEITDPISVDPTDLENQILGLQNDVVSIQNDLNQEVQLITQKYQPQIDSKNTRITALQATLETIYAQVPSVMPSPSQQIAS